MLSVKPWKTEAVIRLLLSIFICVYAGAVVMTLLQPGPGNRLVLPLAIISLLFLAAALALIQIRWSLENLVWHALAVMVCFYAGFLLGAWAQSKAGTSPSQGLVGKMVVAMLSFQGATLIFIWRFLRDHHMSWAEAFGFSNLRVRAILAGL